MGSKISRRLPGTITFIVTGIVLYELRYQIGSGASAPFPQKDLKKEMSPINILATTAQFWYSVSSKDGYSRLSTSAVNPELRVRNDVQGTAALVMGATDRQLVDKMELLPRGGHATQLSKDKFRNRRRKGLTTTELEPVHARVENYSTTIPQQALDWVHKETTTTLMDDRMDPRRGIIKSKFLDVQHKSKFLDAQPNSKFLDVQRVNTTGSQFCDPHKFESSNVSYPSIWILTTIDYFLNYMHGCVARVPTTVDAMVTMGTKGIMDRQLRTSGKAQK